MIRVWDYFGTKFEKSVRLFAARYRVVESIDPTKQTTKYVLTDQLTWEAGKILTTYNNRWVIEEFFRNAKQLTDMEGVTIRSEQGVATALCLVSWIDFLLHFENYKQSTAGILPKESLTIPSIVRQAQYENLQAVVERVKREEGFLQKWLAVEEKNIFKQRKKNKELVLLVEPQDHRLKEAAWANMMPYIWFSKNYFSKIRAYTNCQ